MASLKKAARFFRPRISLRGLLVVVALIGVLLAYLAMQWRSAKRQEAAAVTLKSMGGAWTFNYRLKNYGPDSSSPKQATWVPVWLGELTGPHFFQTVRQIGIGNPNNRTNPKAGDTAMELLQQFPGLRDLELFRSDVTDRGVEQIEHCLEMHYLTFFLNKNITPEAMKSVKKLRRLHTFESTGTLNSEEGISHLKELPNLRELMLGDFHPESTLNNEVVKHIGEMRSLHLLSLYSASITDEGLIHLEQLPQLNELTLDKTKVTPEGVQRLQNALPNCKITVRP